LRFALDTDATNRATKGHYRPKARGYHRNCFRIHARLFIVA